MKLRDYQHQAIRDTYQFFWSGLKSILIYSHTGSGKTVIASRIIADARKATLDNFCLDLVEIRLKVSVFLKNLRRKSQI